MPRSLILGILVTFVALLALAEETAAPPNPPSDTASETADDSSRTDEQSATAAPDAEQDDAEEPGADAAQADEAGNDMAEAVDRQAYEQELLSRISRLRAALRGLNAPSAGAAVGQRRTGLSRGRSEKSRVADFLRYRVQDKKLVRREEIIIDDDAPAVVGRVENSIDNVTVTETGLVFDIVTHLFSAYAEPTDSDHAAAGTLRTERHVVRRVELAQQESTGQLVGFVRTVKDSLADPTGRAWSVIVEPANDPNTVVMDLTGVLYKDGDDAEPASEDETISLRVHADGVLELHQIFQFFKVDRASLRKHRVLRTLDGTPAEVVSYEEQTE